LLGLQGGVIADRFSKRKLILATQVTMGVLALGLGLLDVFGAASLYDVYLFAFLLGVVTAVDNPTGRPSCPSWSVATNCQMPSA